MYNSGQKYGYSKITDKNITDLKSKKFFILQKKMIQLFIIL